MNGELLPIRSHATPELSAHNPDRDADMPASSGRDAINRPWTRRSFLGTAMWGLLARLGARAEKLEQDEQVLLLPALAMPTETSGEWNVQFGAVVYEREQRRLVEAALRELAEAKLGELTDGERRLFAERIQRFLVDHERGKRVELEINGRRLDLGRSGAGGQVKARIRLPAATLVGASFNRDQVVSLDARLTTDGAPRPVRLTVQCLAPRGTSVVSDIDDTIKITDVRNRTEVLRNTLVRPFAAAPGMAELYRGWAGQGASFHYVSGSPWQLFEPLAKFAAAAGFPAGSWHLREFRPKGRQTLRFAAAPAKHKQSVLGPVLKALPERRFILVGDSGELDPEIYGDLARRFPQQIRAIFIRDVTGDTAGSVRYREAFRDVPREHWQVFPEPGALTSVRIENGR